MVPVNRTRALLGMTVMRSFPVLVVAVGASVSLAAQALPVRSLGPVLATAAEPLGSVSQVVVLRSGALIVNDVTGRRIVMFDSTLGRMSLVADSTTQPEVRMVRAWADWSRRLGTAVRRAEGCGSGFDKGRDGAGARAASGGKFSLRFAGFVRRFCSHDGAPADGSRSHHLRDRSKRCAGGSTAASVCRSERVA
jgi:hypothetical protein